MKSAKFYCVSALTALLLIGTGGAVMANENGHDDSSRVSRVNSTQGEVVHVTADDVEIDADTGLIENFMNVKKARQLLAGGQVFIPAEINGTTVKGIGYEETHFGVFDYDRLDELVNPEKKSQSTEKKMTRQKRDASLPGISALSFAKPENITTVSQWAFYGNQISSINLPKVTKIGEAAFCSNSLAQISLGDSNRTNNIEIMEGAFNGQNMSWPSNMVDGWWEFKKDTPQISISHQDPLKWRSLTQFVNPSFKINGVEQLHSDNPTIDLLKTSSDFNQQVTNDPNNEQLTNIPQADSNINKFAIEVIYEPLEQINFTLKQRSKHHSDDPQPTRLGNYSTAAVVTITNPTTPPTTTPDPQPEGEKQPETNNNSGNPININPVPDLDFPHQSESVDKVAKHPHTIYNKQTIRVHKNTDLTSPLKTYKKAARHKAKTFKVLGVAYANNGAKRYKVAGGYVTAHKDYVANAHYQSVPKSKRVKVISTKGIHKYQDVKLTKRPTKSHVKRNKVLKVIKLVNRGNLTRYQLNDGSYISTNKTLIMQSK